MKQLPGLVILIFILTSSGCKQILLRMYGIKKPKIENEISIKRKALKFGLDTSNIISVCDADFLKTLKEANGIPNAIIFDGKGNYIEYRQTDTSCNAGLFKFIRELNPATAYNKPAKLTLNEYISKYRDLKGNRLNNLKPADFYLVIFWTVWTGKLNKDHVKIWEQQAKNNKNAKVEIIKVNLDLQKYWEKSEREKIIERLRKK